MKILFNRNNSIGTLCLLLLLAAVAGACVKDEYAEKEKATVQVTFMTRAESTPQYSSSLLDNEQMKTLRVIVARHDDETGESGDILYNVKYNIEPQETSKTITFSELTVNKGGENFDFYAIANEESVGYSGNWDNVGIDDLKDMNLQTEFLTNANDASTNTVIPQTAYKLINVAPQSDGGIQHKDMKLNFTVAKVRLTINNTSAGDQYVNEIELSGINMESTPLFAEGSLSTVNYGKLSLGYMTIHAGQSATVYAYFFENKGGEYSLTAEWKGDKELKFGSGTTYNIGSIPRGTELDINITLNATTTPSFNIEVVPWTEVKVDVPPFE